MIEFVKMDCDHTLLDVSDEHKANFLKLGNYLFNLPENYDHFDMGDFFAVVQENKRDIYGTEEFDKYYDRRSILLSENHFVEHMNECGTVACVLGHGPLAGIVPAEDENWEKYSRNKFGVDFDDDIGGFFFSMAWASVDNTPLGAAKRIYYALQHGVPEWDNYFSTSMENVVAHLN